MENKEIDLSIVIVNYNGQEWLAKLLPSLYDFYFQKTKFKVETIVVDNASTDNSVPFIQTFKWVQLLKTGHNGGFAFGNNFALKNIQSRYVMLLNSDTEFFSKGSDLDVLIEYMDRYSQTGIITPRVEISEGVMDKACHRGEPDLWTSFTYFIGLAKLFPKSEIFGRYHQTYKNLQEIHTMDVCSGAAMLVRCSAMKEVGLLDERFFMYAEDVDWCKRFREAGYLVVYNPTIKILHHKYKSGIQNSNSTIQSKSQYWFYDTMLQYYDKHYQNHYPKVFRLLLKTYISIKKSRL